MPNFSNGRHCDGPRAAGVATTTSAAAAAVEDEETATPTFPPPTESVGCVAHEDHYDCEGPATGAATATSTAAAAAVGAEEDAEEHDDEHETETPTFPAPTESVGCEAHGDHYHCEGPATAAQATAPPSTTGAVGASNGTTAGTENAPVPFEGGASNTRVISAMGMTGLIGVIALFVL